MRKKRLIFTLLYNEGYFMLSRNFRLQKVGDFNWINQHYNFKNIAFSIDELIILNVSRNSKELIEFGNNIRKIIDNVFVPISVGGGVESMDYAKALFNSGADKIVINSALTEKPLLVKKLIEEYGSQAIVASIDFLAENNNIQIFKNNGSCSIAEYSFSKYIDYVQNLGVGEVYLNSIRKDGTGQGYDLDVIDLYLSQFNIPVIIAGGAGNSKHLIEAIKVPKIDAVATANLFNFLGDSLPNSREAMVSEGIPLAMFKIY